MTDKLTEGALIWVECHSFAAAIASGEMSIPILSKPQEANNVASYPCSFYQRRTSLLITGSLTLPHPATRDFPPTRLSKSLISSRFAINSSKAGWDPAASQGVTLAAHALSWPGHVNLQELIDLRGGTHPSRSLSSVSDNLAQLCHWVRSKGIHESWR